MVLLYCLRPQQLYGFAGFTLGFGRKTRFLPVVRSSTLRIHKGKLSAAITSKASISRTSLVSVVILLRIFSGQHPLVQLGTQPIHPTHWSVYRQTLKLFSFQTLELRRVQFLVSFVSVTPSESWSASSARQFSTPAFQLRIYCRQSLTTSSSRSLSLEVAQQMGYLAHQL